MNFFFDLFLLKEGFFLESLVVEISFFEESKKKKN